MPELTPFEKVLKFHQKFGLFSGANPPPEEITLGIRLIYEEIFELFEQVNLTKDEQQFEIKDPVEFVDAILDTIFVLYGMLARLGLDGDYLFNIVWQANMAKEGGAKRADGKLLKPKNWVPPQKRIREHLIERGFLK